MMEAMWTRFLPAMCQIRSWLHEGVIGEIKHIRATFGFNCPFNPNNRLYNLNLAGGSLLDAGIYPLSFANMVINHPPIEIKALGEIGRTGVDEQTCIILKYESGSLALLNSAINTPTASSAEIVGTKGRILIPRDFLRAQDVHLELIHQKPALHRFSFADETGFKFEIEAASQSIRDGLLENPIMTLSDSLQIMESIDSIKKQLGLRYSNDRDTAVQLRAEGSYV